MASKLVFTSVAALVLVALSIPGHAQRNRDRAQGTVSVCSNYANGCMTVPLRPAGNDYEFRLPGGTWMSCKQSCKDTLRREVIDFWETQRENAGDKQ